MIYPFVLPALLAPILNPGVSVMTANRSGTAPIRVEANHVAEQSFTSSRGYADPFNEVDVTVTVAAPDGHKYEVPAFWAGGNTWKFRYASPRPGRYSYRTACSDSANDSLNGVEGSIEVTPYEGRNLLFVHGPARVADDRRHFEYGDGTPFFWLADTWWMSLTKRLSWPDDFKRLTADRLKKGFTVVQIVAGLYPDMPPFDERGANEAGFPWTADYSRINPEYFDAADQRIRYLVYSGISPCIVGAWGYHLPWMGVKRLEKHWRYVVARWGAYPVFWCVAGEANLPYYLTKGFPFDDREQVKGWTEVARYLRGIDPYHRPLSIHPTGLGKLDARHAVDDVGLLDFDMLQTGHGDQASLAPSVDAARIGYAGKPVMPFLNSEVCYEGILGACHDDIQRLMFWTAMLSGAAGHTYGANGIWQLNREGAPYGKSPHGGDYGPMPWDVAMKLPGSGQLGMSKSFLEQFGWSKLNPIPDGAKYAESEAVVWGDWIWYPEGEPAVDAPVAARYFRRAFTVEPSRTIIRATLRIAADDRHIAFVNRKEVGRGAGWSTIKDLDVTQILTHGRNIIAIQGENGAAPVAKNPAGLLATLTIQYRDNKTEAIVSDSTWLATNRPMEGWQAIGFDDSAWPHAMRAAPYGGGPWGRIADSGPYLAPYSAGIPGGQRIVYVPLPKRIVVHGLRPGGWYGVEWFDPASGKSKRLPVFPASASGEATVDAPAGVSDWVMTFVEEESTKP